MLRFVVGKTGGGKTIFAVAEVIRILRETDHYIITNLALRLHPWCRQEKRGKVVASVPQRGLLAVLLELFGETYNAERRIVFLKDDAEISRFWAVRMTTAEEPERINVPQPPVSVSAEGVEIRRWVFDGQAWRGAVYIIDEGHEYFPAPAWKALQGEGQSWASQNRRSGDEALILTQCPELVALPFRRQSLECYTMVNHAYRTFGPFRHPEVIRYSVHLNTPPNPGETCMRSGSIGLPRKLVQEAYDTASGAGVFGSTADVGRRAKGLPWHSMVWFLLGILGLSVVLFSGCRAGISRLLVRRLPGAPVGGVGAPVVPASAPMEARPLIMPLHLPPALPGSGPAPLPQPEIVVPGKYWGWGRSGTQYCIQGPAGVTFGTRLDHEAGGRLLLDGYPYVQVARPESTSLSK